MPAGARHIRGLSSGQLMLPRTVRVVPLLAPLLCYAPVINAADALSQVTVRWQAPAECPGQAALDAELRRDLAGSNAQSEPLNVMAQVTRSESNVWTVSIAMAGKDGASSRTLTAESCVALAQATSLIIAMRIDPETASSHISESDAAPSTFSTESPPDGTPPIAPGAMGRDIAPVRSRLPFELRPLRFTTRKTRGGSVHAGAWVARAYGVLPSGTTAWGGSLGATLNPWRFELHLGFLQPRHAEGSDAVNPRAGIEVKMTTAGTRLCRKLGTYAFADVLPCAGLEMQGWSGHGNASIAAAQQKSVWGVAPNLGLLALLRPWSWVTVPIRLELLFPTNRSTFGFVNGRGDNVDVFRPSPVSAQFGVGVEFNIQ